MSLVLYQSAVHQYLQFIYHFIAEITFTVKFKLGLLIYLQFLELQFTTFYFSVDCG